jgi:hypothetical protein
MTDFEKKISFLNRYFVYKKIRHVNEAKIQLELGEYQEQDEDRAIKQSQIISKPANVEKVSKTVSKIKKLNTKLILVPATEAIEEKEINQNKETKKRAKKEAVTADLSNLVLDIDTSNGKPEEIKKPRKITKKATKLLIEEDDE